MNINFHKLYLYDFIYQVTVSDDAFCLCKDNGTMRDNMLKAHKGIDNTLYFRALQPDRSPYKSQHGEQVYARIIDPDTKSVVLEKWCKLGPAVGLITLQLNSSDIENIRVGKFNLVLIRTDNIVPTIPGYYSEKPVFTDLDNNVSMEIDITEQALKSPVPSIVITPDKWTPDYQVPISGPVRNCFYSGVLPGAKMMNHLDSVHTFSTFTDHFSGTLEIWGSLEETPDPYLSNTRWFKIKPDLLNSDISFENYTGTKYWSFRSNCLWVKFRYYPSISVADPGVLKKLIMRT